MSWLSVPIGEICGFHCGFRVELSPRRLAVSIPGDAAKGIGRRLATNAVAILDHRHVKVISRVCFVLDHRRGSSSLFTASALGSSFVVSRPRVARSRLSERLRSVIVSRPEKGENDGEQGAPYPQVRASRAGGRGVLPYLRATRPSEGDWPQKNAKNAEKTGRGSRGGPSRFFLS